MVEEEQVFRDAHNPYGHPFIAFTSDKGDSTIFMTPGHHPPVRRLVATFNWMLRHYGVVFLTDRPKESFVEWSFAKYYLAQGNEEVENFRIDLMAKNGSPVTFCEL